MRRWTGEQEKPAELLWDGLRCEGGRVGCGKAQGHAEGLVIPLTLQEAPSRGAPEPCPLPEPIDPVHAHLRGSCCLISLQEGICLIGCCCLIDLHGLFFVRVLLVDMIHCKVGSTF